MESLQLDWSDGVLAISLHCFDVESGVKIELGQSFYMNICCGTALLT